jgi:glyoxylase-like metal-dependent hydrolase (beta-lactamase superfamily II)
MAQLPTSRHFTLHELCEGIYAAIHAPGGWAQSNAGIIDLGDRTLVFDAFLSPLAMQDLLAAAQTLTGRPAHVVMNSHFHNDHIWGNQAVPLDTDIISTVKTRELIAARGTKEDQYNREHAVQRLNETHTRLERASGEREKAHAQYFVVYYEAIIDTLPMLPARVPNIVIQDRLEFTGSKRRARFIARGGHTDSDAILHLPDNHMLFLGDLLFVHAHPYLADGHPDELCQTAAHIKELRADVMVPGHGLLGRGEDVDAMLEYINEMQELVQQAIQDGVSREDIAQRPIPAKYLTWIFPNFYEENVQFLYQLYSTT